MNKRVEESSKQLKIELNEVNNRIERLEERFTYDEITKDHFEKFSQKLKEEKKEIEKQLEKSPLKESNQNQFIEKSLKIIFNLREMWALGDYKTR